MMSDMYPLATVAVSSALLLLIEAFVKKSERLTFWLSLAGLTASAIFSAQDIGKTGTAFSGMISIGGLGAFVSCVILSSAVLTIILLRNYLIGARASFGEAYLLIVFAAAGMMLIAHAADFMILFLGIELMSISLYILAGFTRLRLLANEASLKYFLLGAFATGFLLYGIALMYGVAGTTSIAGMLAKFPSLSLSPIFWCGVGLFITGLAFKVGAVPFHMWVPDVYQGSPTPISGFMGTGAKAAAFSAFLIVFGVHGLHSGELTLALAVLSAASMILGNIVAISQTNIKRMLAYSSIAHAGYMLAGIAAGNAIGGSGVLFYTATYLFMNIGAFGILALSETDQEGNLTYDDYAGMGTRKPMLAALMSIFMFSLAGIPPFGGFIGKYYIFIAAVNANLTWLAIVGVLTSLISVYYYLKLVMVMYFQEGDPHALPDAGLLPSFVLILAAAITLLLGVFPAPLLSVINSLF